MPTNKRSDLTIDNNLATYSFRHEGTILGTYTGQFVFKCFLLPLERLAASKENRELLGEFGVAASNYEKNLALALSELKYRVVSAPPFWNQNTILSGNIADADLIFKVFEAAMDAQDMFLAQKAEEKQKLLESLQKSAEAILQKNREEEESKPKKTEEEELEEELDELSK